MKINPAHQDLPRPNVYAASIEFFIDHAGVKAGQRAHYFVTGDYTGVAMTKLCRLVKEDHHIAPNRANSAVRLRRLKLADCLASPQALQVALNTCQRLGERPNVILLQQRIDALTDLREQGVIDQLGGELSPEFVQAFRDKLAEGAADVVDEIDRRRWA